MVISMSTTRASDILVACAALRLRGRPVASPLRFVFCHSRLAPKRVRTLIHTFHQASFVTLLLTV